MDELLELAEDIYYGADGFGAGPTWGQALDQAAILLDEREAEAAEAEAEMAAEAANERYFEDRADYSNEPWWAQ